MTANEPAGYSGTPLPRKLGLRDGQAALFLALPAELGWLASAVRFADVGTAGDWRALESARDRDLIHGFFTAAQDLREASRFLRPALQPDGMAWISWPKRASRRPTDITEDVIRDIVLPLGLVDVKVAAVDAVGIEAGDPQGVAEFAGQVVGLTSGPMPHRVAALLEKVAPGLECRS